MKRVTVRHRSAWSVEPRIAVFVAGAVILVFILLLKGVANSTSERERGELMVAFRLRLPELKRAQTLIAKELYAARLAVAEAELTRFSEELDRFNGLELDPEYDDLRRSADEFSRSISKAKYEAEKIIERELTIALAGESLWQILKDYADNEIGADIKYKGKVIAIQGRVEDIAKDLLDKPYLILRAEGQALRAQCFLTKAGAEKAAGIRRGDVVTLRGLGVGLLFNVLFEACEPVL